MLRLPGASLVVLLASASISGYLPERQITVMVSRDPDPGVQTAQESQTVGTAALSGTVVDAATGVPIAGAIVRVTRGLSSGVLSTVQSVTCDSQGRFVFTRLPAGPRYTIEAERAGYSPGVLGRDEPDGPQLEQGSHTVSLGADEWRRDSEIRLWKLAHISGRVLDDHGEPLVGVAVRAFTRTTVGARRYLASAALASTSDLGVYRLTDLAPGEYLVGIASSQATVLDSTPEVAPRRPIGALFTGGPPDRGPASVSAPTLALHPGHRLVANSLSVAPAADGSLTAYAPVFYPDARLPSDAEVITLAPGMSRSGLDFRLRAVRTFRVSGRATSPAPVKAPPLLRLLPSGSEELGLSNEVATTQIAPDGTFTFLGVPAGDYTLLVNAGGLEFRHVGRPSARLPDAPGSPDTTLGSALVSGTSLGVVIRSGAPSSVWARQSITVPNADLDDVSVVFRPTLQIRGRIELDADTVVPPTLRGISVTAEPADRDPALGVNSVYVERDTYPTAFSVEGLLPGTFVLRTSSLSVLSVTWRGRDVTDLGVEVTEDVGDVVITVTSRTTELAGVVTGRADVNTGAAVIAFPTDPRLWANYGWRPRRIRSATVQVDGTYSIPNLPAGDYFLIAVDMRQASAWTDPAFLRSAAAQAVRVSLTLGGRTNRDVPHRVIPEPRR
jgi:hypothetical protein